MTVSAGWTAGEIRDLVLEYERQPHGSKGSWLESKGVSVRRFRRWQHAVHLGDVQRGLVPRDDDRVGDSPVRRRVQSDAREAERAAHEAEVARLSARIGELEAVNEALGKAIGLLHQIGAQEPDAAPGTPAPPGS